MPIASCSMCCSTSTSGTRRPCRIWRSGSGTPGTRRSSKVPGRLTWPSAGRWQLLASDAEEDDDSWRRIAEFQIALICDEDTDAHARLEVGPVFVGSLILM